MSVLAAIALGAILLAPGVSYAVTFELDSVLRWDLPGELSLGQVSILPAEDSFGTVVFDIELNTGLIEVRGAWFNLDPGMDARGLELAAHAGGGRLDSGNDGMEAEMAGNRFDLLWTPSRGNHDAPGDYGFRVKMDGGTPLAPEDFLFLSTPEGCREPLPFLLELGSSIGGHGHTVGGSFIVSSSDRWGSPLPSQVPLPSTVSLMLPALALVLLAGRRLRR